MQLRIQFLVQSSPNQEQESREFKFLPLYVLSFSGDLLLSLMIVASVLVGTRQDVPGYITGLLASAYGISYMFAAIFLGRVSDRLGRRNSLLLATSGVIVVSILFIIFSNSVMFALLGEILVGILNGMYWPSIEAYTSEESTHANHQKQINSFCISWSLGYMSGPAVAAILYSYHPVFSFVIMAAFAALNLLIVLFTLPKLPKSLPKPEEGMNGEKNGEKTPKLAIWLSTFILVFLAATYSFTKSFVVGVFPDIAKNDIYLNWPDWQASLSLFVFGLARTVAFLTQSLIKKHTMSLRIFLGFAVSGSLFFFALSKLFIPLFLFSILVGFLTGLVYTMTLEKLLQVNKEGKGQAAGLFESSMGVGTFASALLGGIALSIGNEITAYVLVGFTSIAMAAIALILYLIYKKKEGNSNLL
ncbi:MAG: MFS transporter [Candidatus Hodarchaeota archaeon]